MGLYMDDEEALNTMGMMVSMGMASSMDEACTMLVDSGDINSTQHAALLSKAESERIYGA